MAKPRYFWGFAITLPLIYPACRKEGGDEMQPRAESAREAAPSPVQPAAAPQDAAAPQTVQAKADLKAAEGVDVDGEVKFEETGGGVRVVAEVELTGPSTHGIHIHEKGDCSNIKGKSMGEHFAPAGHQHALPGEATSRHLGDLGNIEVSKDGKGKLEITVPGATLKPGDPNSFLGKALVLHQEKDSGKSKQPSGDSGSPIACGVVEAD